MGLEERVEALERRLAALEGVSAGGESAEGPADVGDLWALHRLKEDLAAIGAEAAAGGVLFTGVLELTADERYEWQYAVLADALLGQDDETDSAVTDSLAALGHPMRLRLLMGILRGRRTVADLAELPEVGTTGQIYHHLRQLTGTGWLHAVGRGRYAVRPARVVPLLVILSAAKP